MSGDPEMMLIARILDTGQMTEAAEAGVKDEWFDSERGLASWAWVRSYWAEHREVPTEEAFTRRFPDGRLEANGEPLGALVAEVRRKHRWLRVSEVLQETVKYFSSHDPSERPELVDEALSFLSTALVELADDIADSTVEAVTETLDDYLEYVLTKEPLSVTGIHTGIDFIDRVSGGMQPEQLFILGGPPKSGKSTIALWCAMQAHAQGERVLFVGHEMSNEEQKQRHLSLGAGVDLNLIKDGLRDSPKRASTERQLRAFIEETKGYGGELFLVHDNNPFLSGIAAKVEQYHPTVVVIDGLYLMHDDNGEADGSPQALTNISRAVKRLARTRKLAIFATTQVLESKMNKKGGVTLLSFGYTSAFGQDADTVLGIWRPDHKEATSNMRVVASRNSLGAEGQVEILLSDGSITDITGDNSVSLNGSVGGRSDLTDSVVEDALEALGVQIVGASGDEIQCYCPVHQLTVGREQSDPRFYMNAESGAALCFTCGWRGNLTRLVDDLEADLDLEDFEFTSLVHRVDRLASSAAAVEDEEADPYVSQYAFDKNPYPPPDALCTRGLTMAEAVRLNLRWDPAQRYWMIPVYAFDGHLLGWQEKGPGYFNNVPPRMRKRRSLFGLAQAVGKRVFVVESPLDVGRFLRYGYAAVATYGAAMSTDQLDTITRRYRDIVLAYDNDRAGWDATASVADQVRRIYGRPVLYYRYPSNSYGEDPGSLNVLQFRHAAANVLAVPPEIVASLREL